MLQRSWLSCPFKWGSALVMRGRLPRSILRGCHGPRLRLLTPPSRYDRDTSPFEWGGERPTTSPNEETPVGEALDSWTFGGKPRSINELGVQKGLDGPWTVGRPRSGHGVAGHHFLVER